MYTRRMDNEARNRGICMAFAIINPSILRIIMEACEKEGFAPLKSRVKYTYSRIDMIYIREFGIQTCFYWMEQS